MNPLTLLLVIFCVLLLLGGLPQVSGNWHGFGYGVSGLGFVILLVLLILLLSGRL